MSTIEILNSHFTTIKTNSEGAASSISHAVEHVSWAKEKIQLDKATTPSNSTAIKCFRGQIFWARLGRNVGSEENKRRPVMILQNNRGNRFGPTTLVAPISDDFSALKIPVNVEMKIQEPDIDNPGVMKDIVYGVLLTGQIRVMNKSRLENKICDLNDDSLLAHNPHIPELKTKINNALKKSLELK